MERGIFSIKCLAMRKNKRQRILICRLLGAFACFLVFAMSYAAPSGDKDVLPPTEKQCQELGIQGLQLKKAANGVWKVLTTKGVQKGMLVHSLPFARDVRGFQGATPLYVYINASGHIEAVRPINNSETPKFFSRACQVLLFWKGKTVKEGLVLKPDATTGATFSTEALIKNMHAALKACFATSKEKKRVK